MARHKWTCKAVLVEKAMNDLRQENADLRRTISKDQSEIARLRNIIRTNSLRRPKMLPQRRIRLAAKQNWKCNLCDSQLNEAFHADHINPWSQSFDDSDENVQVICVPCHLEKTSQENSVRFS
jgi:5-methylcytosine-specific restriction endonuclease McrA